MNEYNKTWDIVSGKELLHFLGPTDKQAMQGLADALEAMQWTHGTHGLCVQNGCIECSLAFSQASVALDAARPFLEKK